MKYMVKVEGGFIGIPREYIGEISLDSEKTQKLISVLKEGSKSDSREMADMLHYQIILQNEGYSYSADYDEKSLPDSIREFLDDIRDKK